MVVLNVTLDCVKILQKFFRWPRILLKVLIKFKFDRMGERLLDEAGYTASEWQKWENETSP